MSKSKKQATSYGKYTYTGKTASSFWYDDYEDSYDYLGEYGGYSKTELDSYKRTNNLYKLASVRRAISNFVQIVTNKSIPVTFATKSDSKTDGERVILSADVDDKFDVSVGLALHEGSHIVLSDFKLLGAMAKCRDRYTSTARSIKYTNEHDTANGVSLSYPNPAAELDRVMADQIKVFPNYDKQLRSIFLSDGKIGSKGMLADEVIDTISGLTNWIEDRRIDMYIFKSAPGYRDYYTSMYDHYFNDKVVTKGIASDEFTNEDIQSYMFRIINLMNENTELSKLKGLRAIYRLLDLKNINRLNNSGDALNVAIDVMDIILTNVMAQNGGQMPQSGEGKGATGENGTGEAKPGDNGDNGGSEDGVAPDGMGQETNDDVIGSGMNASGNVPTDTTGKPDSDNKLSKNAAEQLIKKFQKQKDFLNGNIKKKSVSKEEVNKLSDIQESESELVRVGGGIDSGYGRISQGVDCIVVKKLTGNLLKSDDFPFASCDWKTKEPMVWAEDEVRRGITLGTMLGKKLQLRSESRETIFSRLKKGRIDKRMIASLGYDNDGVFYTNEIDQYKKGNLHISLDYSGSMSGTKLKRTITSVVAIVKACEMARNLNVQVSIRSTDSGRNGGKSLPYICLIHDSRRDSFKQFAKYMSILDCNNTTPEGLCFEAIQKYLIPTDNSVDSYFLNFSDGQPCYSISTKTDSISYNGSAAAEHTNRQVKKMRDSGINVLSYFITERAGDRFESSHDWEIFKKSYDKSAKYVDVENVFQVAKSMNELFLQKASRD
jgi:hypothetical protein